jgi:hypothetical protein
MKLPATVEALVRLRDQVNDALAEAGYEIDERAELVRVRESMWVHLDAETAVGTQKMGVGAIAGQLVKTIQAIAQIDRANTAETVKEPTLADALAAARESRTERQAQSSRRSS